MAENYLYEKISNSVRQEILDGKLKPGDRLPSVRTLAAEWGCTQGTVQRAYQELASQGLVTSRAGQGTKVVEKAPGEGETPLRRLSLIHRAEAFLLLILTAGYTPEEVEEALRLSLDRWRSIIREPQAHDQKILRFVGSHDLAITWMAAHFHEILPDTRLKVRFTGSLGGLIALAQGEADIAGSHLWDESSDRYNEPYVRRLMPGKRVALITLFERNLGLILPKGNPKQVTRLRDLVQPEIRFVNRQPGSGTRVWLDCMLTNLEISPGQIQGYEHEKTTHSEVAQAVAEGAADVGVGLEASARAYDLDFIFLKEERYDLIVPADNMNLASVQALRTWLESSEVKRSVAEFGGYRTESTGQVRWMD